MKERDELRQELGTPKTPAGFNPKTMVDVRSALKDSGHRAQFLGGGMREGQGDRARFDLCVPEGVPYDEQLLTRFAVHMAKGAAKYEERNWEKFSDQQALDRARASAMRHLYQWVTDAQDGEDHAAAVMFNLMAGEHIQRKLDIQRTADEYEAERIEKGHEW